MNRPDYYGYISRKLNALAYEIDSNGKLNVLNLNNHAEPFYRDFFNKIFGWELKDLNSTEQNVEAIDLACDNNKTIIQVSATCTKAKIEDALSKEIIKKYKGENYCFKFVSISKDASNLRKNSYTNPSGIAFNPSEDIYDVVLILRAIFALDIDRQKEVYVFVKKELGQEIDVENLDSNLASVIDILSKEDLDKNDYPITTNSFEIDRKISFNNFNIAKDVINDYGMHYNRLDKIYSEFDKLAANKSNSVLATIRTEYLKNIKVKDDDELFFLIIDEIKEKIIQSPNFNKIPIEELDSCVNIVIVDAFIRCKIFKNPENYKHVAT